MIVGVPKEIKDNEYRVGLLPSGVEALVKAGHKVIVQKNAGSGVGVSDDGYVKAGAEIRETAKDIFKEAQMIVKIKEPIGPEFQMAKEGQVWFTYFHLAGDEALTKKTLETKMIGIAYETIETDDGKLPLLIPMSEVAGRLAVQEGAKYLEKTYGGRGVLLGGVSGVPPAKVVVLGAGIVGINAMQMAVGMGADVTVVTRSTEKLRSIDLAYHGRVKTLKSNPWNIREVIKDADIVVTGVLMAGTKAPWVITRDMLKTMRKGAVIVDVSIDQGGCCETSKPTSHSEPIYEVDGVLHYCVANMPGCVPLTSTYAITNETVPYALEIANKGYKKACLENRMLLRGLNVLKGKLTYKPVADVFNLPYTPPEKALAEE
jgi:alanine dehydrogenase